MSLLLHTANPTGLVTYGFISLLLAIYPAQKAAAAEPSAQEIIEQAQRIMNSTMEYHISIPDKSATTVVDQKVLTNGTIVSRCLTDSSIIRTDFLFSNGKNYQLFKNATVAVDMDSLEATGLTPSVNPFALISTSTAQFKGLTTFEGKSCYVVRAQLAPRDTNLIAKLPASVLLPDAVQYLIETNTWRVLQMIVLHGESTYVTMDFTDFRDLPNVAEDFFTLPKDCKIEKPTSLSQYVKLTMKYTTSGPKNIPKGFAFDSDNQEIVRVDPKTGAFIRLTTNSVDLSGYQIAAQDGHKGTRLIILSMLAITTVGMLLLVIKHRWRQTKA